MLTLLKNMKKYVLTSVTLFFLVTTLSGCAFLMYNGYYEPFADSGRIYQAKSLDYLYPELKDRIFLGAIGADIFCQTNSLFLISSGPVLWRDPLLPLPIIPVLLPLPYLPKGIMLRIDFRPQVKSIELDPRNITLLTGDEGIAKPQYIKYRLGAAKFVITPPMTEPIVIEDASRMSYIELYFEQSALMTSSFVFTIGDLKVNNSKVNFPRIVFRKKRNLFLLISGEE